MVKYKVSFFYSVNVDVDYKKLTAFKYILHIFFHLEYAWTVFVYFLGKWYLNIFYSIYTLIDWSIIFCLFFPSIYFLFFIFFFLWTSVSSLKPAHGTILLLYYLSSATVRFNSIVRTKNNLFPTLLVSRRHAVCTPRGGAMSRWSPRREESSHTI